MISKLAACSSSSLVLQGWAGLPSGTATLRSAHNADSRSVNADNRRVHAMQQKAQLRATRPPTWDFLVGITVLRLISLVITPPTVSMPCRGGKAGRRGIGEVVHGWKDVGHSCGSMCRRRLNRTPFPAPGSRPCQQRKHYGSVAMRAAVPQPAHQGQGAHVQQQDVLHLVAALARQDAALQQHKSISRADVMAKH